MKRLSVYLLATIVAALFSICAYASDPAASAALQQPSTTLRIGNKYIVDQQVMNSRAYMGYLKNTCPEAYDTYRSGYVTAMTGWGLFSAGPVLSLCVGLPVILSACKCADEAQASLHAGVSSVLFALGSGAFISGVTCLAVGYARMHKGATLYNHQCTNPTTYWSLQSTSDGVGIAFHF